MSVPTVGLAIPVTDLFSNTDRQRITQDTVKDLVAFAINGETDALKQYLLDFDPKTVNDAMFVILFQNSIWRSVENNNLDCYKILCDYIKTVFPNEFKNNPFNTEYIILATLRHNSTNFFEEVLSAENLAMHLIKNDKYFEMQLIYAALEGGSIEGCNRVLEVVSSKKIRNEGLAYACEHNNDELFELFYPLANAQTVLNYLSKRKTISDDQRAMLEERMAEELKASINAEIGDQSHRTTRKMKL